MLVLLARPQSQPVRPLLLGAPVSRGPAPRVFSATLSGRVGKVVGYPPRSELDDLQRREFHEELLDADSFEDLPGKWLAAILEAEQKRQKLRLVADD